MQYLKNQRSRMNYAEYRKLGLPITSSHIESTIKQINRRMKGTVTPAVFWQTDHTVVHCSESLGRCQIIHDFAAKPSPTTE